MLRRPILAPHIARLIGHLSYFLDYNLHYSFWQNGTIYKGSGHSSDEKLSSGEQEGKSLSLGIKVVGASLILNNFFLAERRCKRNLKAWTL